MEKNNDRFKKRTLFPRRIDRVDVQVSLFTGAVVIVSCLTVLFVCYHLTYQNMIDNLVGRVHSIHGYVENFLETSTFEEIDGPEDMESQLYIQAQDVFYRTKIATGVAYLYTAKRTQDGRFIYVVDGLEPDASDFRRPGDAIEPEIIPELERALAGEEVWPDDIKHTDWGKIFIAYLPVHDGARVVGVVGIEFRADGQYDTYLRLRILAPLVAVIACLLAAMLAAAMFRRISNPSYRDLSNTDQLTQLKSRNAYEVDLGNLDTRNIREGVGICLIDLNDLKLVNDTLGHQAGDEYLQCAARVIRELAPHGSAVYRVGGDEFVVIARGKSLEELGEWSERVKTAFAQAKPPWDIDLSLSMGCALFDRKQDLGLENTYRRADQRMYCQKRDHYRSGH